MFLILSENEFTESGIRYADSTGVSYEYPRSYRRLIQPGVPFIYYRGRKAKRGRRMPVYFGSGVIGDVAVEPNSVGRLNCEIEQYRPFPQPVPFKVGHAGYLESGGSRSGYFQSGVRKISERDFVGILEASAATNVIQVPTEKQGSKHEAIWRMTRTARATTSYANGQKVLRTLKDKALPLTNEDLASHISQLIEAQSGRCALTGLALQFDGDCKDSELLCSLDRINSSGHYIPGNLQIVCRFVNRWKADEKDTEFKRLLALVKGTENSQPF